MERVLFFNQLLTAKNGIICQFAGSKIKGEKLWKPTHRLTLAL